MENLNVNNLRCPICGEDHWKISTIATLREGTEETITCRCQNCRYTWDEKISKTEEEIKEG